MDKVFILPWLVLLVLGSCNGKPGSAEKDPSLSTTESAVIVSIDSRDAKALLDVEDDIILLDVRTPEEFAEGHLAGAKNIDYHDPNFTELIKQLDPDRKYLLYCAVGGRSGKSLKIMDEMGFKEVYNVSEGFKELREQGLPVGPVPQ